MVVDSDIDGSCGGRDRFAYHGGALDAARAAFPQAPEPWVDLSTGINPIPYPVPPLADAAWARLPDRSAIRGLEAAAARAYGADAADVVAAPGTEALIARLPGLLPARRTGVLGPTYGGHVRAWRGAGAAVEAVSTLDALEGLDVAVVVNPNNPDGRCIAPAALAALAGRVGWLVVDEAFADVAPAALSLASAPPPNAVVLRSFGKFYGLAGLRLGFAVARPALAEGLRDALGDWPVSGPAVAIGSAAFGDGPWADRARARLRHDADRLDAQLTEAGAAILGGTTLFRLATVGDAGRWFDALGRAGILTRPFADDARRLRFGLPGDEAAWRRLRRALTTVGAVA